MQTEPQPLPTSIGPYTVERKIASGGMGEIYLVNDLACDRKIALKKIRSDRVKYPTLKDRFLREAKISAQMSHPSIIPIYTIHFDDELLYYTMPYVEGDTLKQILRKSIDEEKEGVATHQASVSIPSLMRIFLNICQAIAYCHNRGVLHRDLKPENIIVGKYGETFILDWGLADFVDNPLKEIDENFPKVELVDLTRPGKIPGTLAYIPPERILGQPSSFSTDIYAMGVILYQLLTLKMPFHRSADKKLKKQIEKEELIDPLDRAPYRDIPLELAVIAKKCLSPKPELRYATMEELIFDIENYIAGKGQWIEKPPMKIDEKTDWEFQENILLAKHVALSRSSDMMEWVTLMLSKKGFSGNLMLQTAVVLKPQSQGLGFLLNIPEVCERKGLLEESHSFWIGSKSNPGCSMMRSNLQVICAPDVSLLPEKRHVIRVERVDNHLRLFIDGQLCLDYLTHTPFSGPHFGLMLKDADLTIEPIHIFVSSPNILINCLKVPDTFLSSKIYPKAIAEYRKISSSFPGRYEGREAIFRGGITLVEEAKECRSPAVKSTLLQQALEEFGKLKPTPGAPLEYLGKSLVYKASEELEEEMKCLELCLRKYGKHPLKHLIEEEIAFRLHEAAYQDRTAAFHLALLSIRHLPHIFKQPQHMSLLVSLKNNFEPLPFIEPYESKEDEKKHLELSIELAFLLVKPTTLVEIIESSVETPHIANALFCLIMLGHVSFAEESLCNLKEDQERHEDISLLIQYEKNLLTAFDLISKLKTKNTFSSHRILCHVLEKEKTSKKSQLSLEEMHVLAKSSKSLTNACLFFLLSQREYHLSSSLLDGSKISEESKNFFQGCLIAHKKGIKEALFFLYEHPSYYSFHTLFVEREGKTQKKECLSLFFWEKTNLFEQISLFLQCCEKKEEAKKWNKYLQTEKNNVRKLFNHS